MGSENSNGKVPLISKIAYGFGDVGCNFSWMFVSNFLMIFYTDVFRKDKRILISSRNIRKISIFRPAASVFVKTQIPKLSNYL